MLSQSAKTANLLDPISSDTERLVEDLADEMAQRWQEGEQPRVEDFLARYQQLHENPEAALELLYEEIHLRQEQGQEVRADELLGRFPQWRRQVQTLLEFHHLLAPELAGPLFPAAGDSLGEFRLLAELGHGTASRVFLAAQPSLANRPVVLKLSPHGGCEHLSLARLQHTHIVPLHSAHDFPTRRLRALCLPYFGGTTLDRIMDALRDIPPGQRTGEHLVRALRFGERRASAGWWNPNQPADAGRSPNQLSDFLSRLSYVQAVCWIAACLSDGLHYAHERGLLHLDLKPSNVLLAADGQPMLLDFHLARPPVPAGAAAPVWMGGTPGYMAPEQQAALEAVARRETVAAAVDVRADIYSLGVLLYELLGGQRPDSTPSLRRLNPGVSAGLADVVARCLRPTPERRYASAAELAADLRRHLADLPLRGVANRSWRERWGKWRRRRPHALSLWILLLAVSAAAGFALDHVHRQSHKAESSLINGQNYLDQHRYAEALHTFKHGIDLVEDLPFGAELKQHLHDRLHEAECGQAIQELHLFRERVWPLHNAASLPEAQAQTVEAHCRSIWEQREAILERLRPRPDSELKRQFRTDLLDLALLAANLRVRLAAPDEAAAAREQALKILDEAEAFFGPSPKLRREREIHAQSLDKQS